MLFEQQPRPRTRTRLTSGSCIMAAESNRQAYRSALMTRGGAASEAPSAYHRLKAFVNKRFFLLGAATMVTLARFFPSYGTTGGLLSLIVSKAGELDGKLVGCPESRQKVRVVLLSKSPTF